MGETITKRDLRFGYRFVVLTIVVITLFGKASGLNCYQCNGFMTNEECNKPENLKPCKDEDALVYDVCESLVKIVGNQKQITKVCAKGPCVLETKNQNSALNTAEECVGDECRFCCSEDGCNTSSATPIKRTVMPTAIVAVLALCLRLLL
ncbi:ly6/PLAUR domain-containing protein 1-like [Liolophura sinensis]|uniref:ly6/PLAUR domain-containing protein 1-like n=1 Tax=Liolophura sinensis TaxID=3198878 RepID=UPI00315878DA